MEPIVLGERGFASWAPPGLNHSVCRRTASEAAAGRTDARDLVSPVQSLFRNDLWSSLTR